MYSNGSDKAKPRHSTGKLAHGQLHLLDVHTLGEARHLCSPRRKHIRRVTLNDTRLWTLKFINSFVMIRHFIGV